MNDNQDFKDFFTWLTTHSQYKPFFQDQNDESVLYETSWTAVIQHWRSLVGKGAGLCTQSEHVLERAPTFEY